MIKKHYDRTGERASPLQKYHNRFPWSGPLWAALFFFILYALIGLLLNTKFFKKTTEKDYLVFMIRMDAKKLNNTLFAYELGEIFVGYYLVGPVAAIFGCPFWAWLVIPFLAAFMKLFGAGFLSLRYQMFSKKHKDEINWNALDEQIDEYGFRKFYDTYYKLGQYLLGDIDESSLTNLDKRMLKDVWSELTLPKSGSGLKNKLSIARNTMQARWKYSYFTEISMLQALLIQVKGFFFIKNPTLD